tara:strand:- start:2189 stop:2404 length:216 start_codon:yes stop_codon:yes gene_type:complete
VNGREKFLLTTLAVVFISQIVTLGWGIHLCAKGEGLAACPEIGKRFDATYAVIISTTLALLTGSTMTSKKE